MPNLLLNIYTVFVILMELYLYLIKTFSGILEREQEQSVVYGSIDFGKTVVKNEKYNELVSIIMHNIS